MSAGTEDWSAHAVGEGSWRGGALARPGRIRAAALHCFRRRGVSNTRLEDVARAARVSKGSIYLHFNNKEHLLEDLATHLFRAAHVRLTGLLEGGATASEKLTRLLSPDWRGELYEASQLVQDAPGQSSLTTLRAAALHEMAAQVEVFLEVGAERGELRAVEDPYSVGLWIVAGPQTLGALGLPDRRAALIVQFTRLLTRELLEAPPVGA